MSNMDGENNLLANHPILPLERKDSLENHAMNSGEVTLSPSIAAEPPAKLTRGLIIKAYDDCRQDTLALQVMRLLETIWESEGIDIPLKVYNVTPARTSDSNHAMGGLIECVRDSDSRDNLGKKGFVSLKMYYEVGFHPSI